MDLRITPQTTLNHALGHLDRQTRLLGKLQAQAASGKRVETPSDDPVALGAILSAHAQDNRLDAYLTAMQESRSSLNASVAALQGAAAVLGKAQTIAVEASHSANSSSALETMAQQVDRLIDEMLDAVNAKHGDRYLFAGTETRTQPFAIVTSDSAGRPLTVAYQGANDRNAAPISVGQTVATLYSGAQAFQGRGRGATVFHGTTGAKPGAGTDSAVGEGTLQVRHTATTFASGSGIQAGTSSAAGDTILGPAGAHQLVINDTSGVGAAGTVSLNGGPPILFANTDTNLRVTGPSGEVVFLDTTAITANFVGTVSITATGTLSLDGGASATTIDFTANQTVTDSVSGAVVNVNTTAIQRTGDEQIDFRGTYDAFQILIALRDDLRNVHGRTESEQLASISQRIEELTRVRNGVLEVTGEQSASLQHLDNLETHARDVQLNLKQSLSELEEADLSELVVQLQAQQNQLQLTLATLARLQEQSLLDYLR